MKTIDKIMMFACMLMMQACGKELPEGALHATYDKPFRLTYGQTAVTTDSLKIKLVDVPSDSRCATGAVCVWEGEVVLELEIMGSNKTQTSVFRFSPGQADPAMDTLDQVMIELHEVFPHPDLKVNYGSIDINDYQLDMTIRKL